MLGLKTERSTLSLGLQCRKGSWIHLDRGRNMRWGCTENASVPTPVKICKSHALYADVGKWPVQRVRPLNPLIYYTKDFIHCSAGQEKWTPVLIPKSFTLRIWSMLWGLSNGEQTVILWGGNNVRQLREECISIFLIVLYWRSHIITIFFPTNHD